MAANSRSGPGKGGGTAYLVILILALIIAAVSVVFGMETMREYGQDGGVGSAWMFAAIAAVFGLVVIVCAVMLWLSGRHRPVD